MMIIIMMSEYVPSEGIRSLFLERTINSTIIIIIMIMIMMMGCLSFFKSSLLNKLSTAQYRLYARVCVYAVCVFAVFSHAP